MLNIKTLRCSNCNSVLFNLPQAEITKLNGNTFYCEFCGQHNLLVDFKFDRVPANRPPVNVLSYEAIQGF